MVAYLGGGTSKAFSGLKGAFHLMPEALLSHKLVLPFRFEDGKKV